MGAGRRVFVAGPPLLTATVLTTTVLAVTVLAVTGLLIGGLLAAGWWSERPLDSTPEGNDQAWDGERFLVIGDDRHWSTVDGERWHPHRGLPPQAASDRRCPSGFDCANDTRPPPPIPFHHGWSRVDPMAATDDIVVLAEWHHHELNGMMADPQQDRLAADLVALLGREAGGCFARDDAATDIVLHGVTTDPTGRPSYRLEAQCNGQSVGVDLADFMSPAEVAAALHPCPGRLLVERRGQAAVEVTDPPRHSHPGDPEAPPPNCLSTVVATADLLWALDGTDLVASADGLDWGIVPLPDHEGLRPSAVQAGAPDSIVVAFTPERGNDPVAIISHDRGRTWSEPTVRWPGFGRFSVGPGGVTWGIGDSVQWSTADDFGTLHDPSSAGGIRPVMGHDSILAAVPRPDGSVDYRVIPMSQLGDTPGQ